MVYDASFEGWDPLFVSSLSLLFFFTYALPVVTVARRTRSATRDIGSSCKAYLCLWAPETQKQDQAAIRGLCFF
jgi:hypothetical protein